MILPLNVMAIVSVVAWNTSHIIISIALLGVVARWESSSPIVNKLINK